ncbi:MAG: alpha/beta hydrolase [Gammaproteobacteria bacterium]|nr:alpha/beta hydrolase [Gammaproteobacteria bacterium]MDH5803265.1 alpha/beta hydrolase [Gammaproteobacteria bacterium]
MLETIEIQSGNEADAAVIWLHGLGADGNDFAPIVSQLGLKDLNRIRFVFPHAPKQPVTLNNGFVMRAWYDIKTPMLLEQQDESGIQQSQAAVLQLIEKEKASGIDSTRIILAGFSQGGAIALHTGIRFSEPLGGIMVLSSYLPLADTAATQAHEANHQTSIFMAHGSYDPVVPIQAGDMSQQQLQSMGYPVQWHTYPMEHSVCLEEIEEIGLWINACLG